MLKYLVLFYVFSVLATAQISNIIPEELLNVTKKEGRDEANWSPPNFLNQDTALGYLEKDFTTSPELRDRVLFWTQIYGTYSSRQGIMHDRKDLRLIYGTVDFSSLEGDLSLSRSQMERAKDKIVKKKRDEILNILVKLAAIEKIEDLSEPLSEDELKIWKLFPEQNRREKILAAANKDSIRFQLGQSDYFLKGIYYSGRYLKEMEKIFREEGLPVELTRLPFVESSFNIFARSKVGASGIWQFMRRTGRDYLRINKSVDERNDPLASSRAAARLLRNNFKDLQSWPLAITAYNHGPSGMKKLMREYQTTNIADLIERAESRTFQFASKNFYACFLAALDVEAHADKYFPKPTIAPEIPFETYILPTAAYYKSLVKIFEGDLMKAEMLNPQFTSLVKRGALQMPKSSKLRIPLQKTAEYNNLLKSPSSKELIEVSVASGNPYRVVRGDSLYDIAQTFGVSVKSLMDLNAITNPKSLRPGQTLMIPAND